MWGNIWAFPHILWSPSSYMTSQLLHSELAYLWGKFDFLFYQWFFFRSSASLFFLLALYLSCWLSFPVFPLTVKVGEYCNGSPFPTPPNSHLMLKYIFIYLALGRPHHAFSIYIHVRLVRTVCEQERTSKCPHRAQEQCLCRLFTSKKYWRCSVFLTVLHTVCEQERTTECPHRAQEQGLCHLYTSKKYWRCSVFLTVLQLACNLLYVLLKQCLILTLFVFTFWKICAIRAF